MNITKIDTMTGRWLEFEEATAKDFHVTVGSPKLTESKKYFIGTLMIRPVQNVTDELSLVVENAMEFSDVIRRTSFAPYGLQRYATLKEMVDALVERRDIRVTVPLKNVRKQETINERVRATEIIAKREISLKGERVQKVIEETVATFNRGILRFVEEVNERTLDGLKSALSTSEKWREYADKRAPESNDLRVEISELQAEADKIIAAISKKQALLQEARGRACIAAFEQDKWHWGRGDKDQHRLPEPYIAAMKTAVAEGKAFDFNSQRLFLRGV